MKKFLWFLHYVKISDFIFYIQFGKLKRSSNFYNVSNLIFRTKIDKKSIIGYLFFDSILTLLLILNASMQKKSRPFSIRLTSLLI